MGSKKKNRQAALAPDTRTGEGPPWVLIAGIVAVAALAAFALFPSSSSVPEPANDVASAETDLPHETESEPRPDAPVVPTRPASPKPPPEAPLPALPIVTNLVPRPPNVIRGSYAFVANNPDVSEYVPCFCGCETRGHTSNADCFVSSRNADGSVKGWDTHGMACIVCVDVAHQCQQLHASGASVQDIRTAVEAHYSGSPSQTPTPAPPAP